MIRRIDHMWSDDSARSFSRLNRYFSAGSGAWADMAYVDSVRDGPRNALCKVQPAENGLGEEDRMFRMVTNIAKWVFIPVLLIGSLFACCAASYEPLVDLAIGLGAMIFVQRAIWLKEYFWAAGFLAIVVVFTPLPLVVKALFLMGLTCAATFANLLAAFRTQPAPAS